jgi:hypothetical protein
MLIICSWCKEFLGEKEPIDDISISHSICENCYGKVIDEVKKLSGERKECMRMQRNKTRQRRG